MLGSRSSTPVKSSTAPPPLDISPLLASELAIEYASLRAAGNCPTGMYLTPSPDTLLKWHGVFFVHGGPYAGSLMRFTILFLPSFPQTCPTVRFDSEVYHHPKTKIWFPRGRLAQWQVHHVPHILHDLKHSFKISSLDSIKEDEAVNKQIWSLYHHSRQTFLSMTAQRALHSVSRSALYPSAKSTSEVPSTPAKIHETHLSSTSSTLSKAEESPITFRELGEEEKQQIWEGAKKSLGL